MTNTRTTYRRTDDEPILYVDSATIEVDVDDIGDPNNVNLIGCDGVIETEWKKIRTRVIEVGSLKLCQECGGRKIQSFTARLLPPCSVCNGAGVQEQIQHPPWTEITPDWKSISRRATQYLKEVLRGNGLLTRIEMQNVIDRFDEACKIDASEPDWYIAAGDKPFVPPTVHNWRISAHNADVYRDEA